MASVKVKKSIKVESVEKGKAKQSLKLTEEQTFRMLELYQTEPCLFDINSESYRNRDMRSTAAKRISDALNIPGFGPKEVVIKFKNLRNAYSQELRKIKDSEVSGAGSEDLYTPTVYWFELMDNFLRPHIYARPTKTNLVAGDNQKCMTGHNYELQDVSDVLDETEIIEEANNWSDVGSESILENATFSLHKSVEPSTSNTKAVEKENTNSNGKRHAEHIESRPDKMLKFLANRKKSTPPLTAQKQATSTESQLNEAVGKLHEISKSAASLRQEDMYDNFGKYIASLLRSMNDQSKAIKIQQELTNVVYKRMNSSNDIPSGNASVYNYSSYDNSTNHSILQDLDSGDIIPTDEDDFDHNAFLNKLSG